MRHSAPLAVLFSGVSLLVAPWAATAQPSRPGASLQQKLRAQYPAGATLVVQKPGILGAADCTVLPLAEYRDGQLHRPGRVQEIALVGARCAMRDFPVGWRVTLESLTVNRNGGKVSFHFVECDACNSPAASSSFRAAVDFDFPAGSLDPADATAVQKTIGEVFAVDASAPAPAPPAAAAAPDVSPAPAPAAASSTLGTLYVSVLNADNRLILNADGSLLLLENGHPYNGAYSAEGSVLKIHIPQLNRDTRMTIDGPQLIAGGGGIWLQPNPQAAAPEQQAALPDQPTPSGPPTIRKGDNFDQVKDKLGQPANVMDLGAKVIYLYKNLKVTFIDGKVSDIE